MQTLPCLTRWCFLVALSVAACSAADSEPNRRTGGGSGGTSSNAPRCDVISIAELEAILGVTELDTPRLTDVGALAHCQYPQGTIPAVVQIRYDLATKRSDFDEIRTSFDADGYVTTDVQGLGETAFTSSVANVVTVGTFTSGKSLVVNAPAPLERVRALCAELLTRI